MNNKLLTALSATILIGSGTPTFAEPQVRGWNTMDSLGCMMVQDCTDGVNQIVSTESLEIASGVSYDNVRDEADAIITELGKMGVNVYLADSKYFPPGHAGVYYTVSNHFFLNEQYSWDPQQMLETIRHEAWHAGQDSMACGIENTNIAVIYPMETVPQQYVMMAEIAYPESARPWEQEAKWAGATPGMTLDVLRLINESDGRLWDVIEPTPLTREWLEVKGCF